MAVSKVKSYSQIFKDSYSQEFPHIKSSTKGAKFAFCEVCRSDFNISHAGRYDVSRHVKGPKHIDNAKCAESNAKVNSFFKNDTQSDVLRAELLFTSFLVEHNVPISAADHAGPLFRKMFPKCDIAKLYGSARTKTTAVIHEMASDKTSTVVKYLQAGPFSAACDGSNDNEFKLYPIVVSFFNPVESFIQGSLLCIPNLVGDSTGENISALILNEFERLKIPFEHCIAFSADNASVMQGKRNGVVAFLKQKQMNLISIGCSCHLINLASEKGAATLPAKVDEMLIDIFYYLKKSAKRKETLRKFQGLYNMEAQKILKHVCTRWLSLGRSLTRLVVQWDPLTSFFKDIVKAHNLPESLSSFQIPKVAVKVSSDNCVDKCAKKQPKLATKRKNPSTEEYPTKKRALLNQSAVLNREEKIFMFLSSPINKAYSLFLLSVIPVFERANTVLQSGSPHIHKLKEILHDLLKELFSKFVKPSEVKHNALIEVNYHSPTNHKDHRDMLIGNSTFEVVSHLTEEEKKGFFSAITKYFVTSCDYIINKFPLRNEILNHAEIADLDKIENSSFSSIRYFLDLFPFMLQTKSNETYNQALDELEKQFCCLQLENIAAIIKEHKRIDVQWAEVGKIKGADDLLKFDRLASVMLSILLIPHSNAECERVFSLVRKNRNEFRSSMSNKTLENLLVIKTQNSKPCYEQVFNEEFLKRAKRPL